MGIKKLSEVKQRNRQVGFIGTVKGEIVEVNVGTTKKGQPYANGKVLLDGARHPTSFVVFNTRNNENLVSQFIAKCEEDANVIFTSVVAQEPYEKDGKTRIATKLTIISIPDPDKAAKIKDFTTFNFMGEHREEGTVYDTMDDGRSYLIFKLDVKRSWFNKDEQKEESRTENFELVAYGDQADKVAMEHAETPNGTMVQGKATIDGNRINIKSLVVAPPPSDENSEEVPFS